MSVRYYFYKTLHVTLLMGLLLILLTALVTAIFKWYLIPQLPPAEHLKDIRFQVPLHIYTKDNIFMAEYGEQRRVPLQANQMPPLLIKAVLAAEDDRFFEHRGVDLKGLLRATVSLVKTGEKRQGGSTITMQVARNFFLSHARTFSRKFDEILLAFKIEEELSKEEILELYLNKIFFGHRAYGVGAAAQIYYGKNLNQLTLAELAILASLPKAPSTNNPLTNPNRALERRNYILRRMLELNYITQEEYDEAVKAPNTAKHYKLTPQTEALYVAEMVRSFLLNQFGEEATYTNGYKVFTTIDSQLQKVGQLALRQALFRYDHRHGYRGPFDQVELTKGLSQEEEEKKAFEILENYRELGGLVPSLVLKTIGQKIVAYNRRAGRFIIRWGDMSWARRYIHENRRGRYPKNASHIVARGDIIMVRPLTTQKKDKKDNRLYQEQIINDDDLLSSKYKNIRWRLSQVPEIEGALVAVDPKDGAILALAGGFDFYRSKFNRVTQAERQPGSTFKPFIYSAALKKGFSPASVVKDAPIVFKVGGVKWRPQNYSHKYYGHTTLRKALAYSHNVSSVRLLNRVGVSRAIDHITKFGFKREKIPKNLTIALGTGDLTPLELTTGFAVFANGGFLIKPYFIDRIEDVDGKVIYSASPLRVCQKCPPEILASEKEVETGLVVSHSVCTPTPRYAPRVISAYNARTMTSMLREVIRMGTGRKANNAIGRTDIVGKTGTTNNQRDAWFAGYSPFNIVTTVWMGFDKPRSLGYKETGGFTALPMWVDFMKVALKDQPVRSISVPKGTIAKKESSSSQQYYRKGGSRSQSKSKSYNRKKYSKNVKSSKSSSYRKKIKPNYSKRKSPNRPQSSKPRSGNRNSTSSKKSSTVIPEQLF